MDLQILKRWLKQRPLFRPNRLGIGQACIIGAVAGLSAALLASGMEWLTAVRLHLVSNPSLPAWVVLPTFGLVGGFVAGWLVQDFGPEATGSGIPQVKAVLARVNISALNMPTALVKFIGGIIVLGCGLFMGREGPTVHVCASLASEINRLVPTTPEQRRQLIAAGAGAGLAAAFHAPIAGVMFVLEELLKDISSATIGTAVLACFVGSVTSTMWHQGSDASGLSEAAAHARFFVRDIPWFIIIGVLAGLFGAFFNRCIIWMLTFFRDRVALPLACKIALAGLLSGLIISLLPPEFANYEGIRQAVLTGHASLPTVGLVFCVFFFLTVLAYGSGAPGGLFAPALSIGTALGYGVGAFALMFDKHGSPEAFAIAGMGAMFASVARVPVTAIIIIFEMTRSFELVLPLMIVSIVASLVADRLYPQSIYDRLMDWGGIKPQEDVTIKHAVGNKIAEDIMTVSPLTLDSEQPVSEALEKIKLTRHERFPVVHDGKLVGIATLADFEMLACSEVSKNSLVGDIMTTQPVHVLADEPLANVVLLFERYKLTLLPVILNESVIGVITRTDLIHTIYSESADGAESVPENAH